MANSKALAIVPMNKYAVMSMDLTGGNIAEVMAENLGMETLTAHDFDKIKIPSGGGTVWMVPTLEGEEEPQKELVGVIMHWTQPRAYWQQSFEESGGNTPPDCYSEDGTIGTAMVPDLAWYDNEGHSQRCDSCPFSQFGSDGRGQACKQMRLLFLLTPDNALPVVIAAPPTSIKGLKKYFMRLGSKAIPYYGAQTKLTLVKDKNKDGIEYAKVQADFVTRLNPEETAHVKAYADQLRAAMNAVRIDATDYAVGDIVEE